MPEFDDLFWDEERQELIRILLPIVNGAATSAAETALKGMQEMGIGVDWRLVNEAVLRWAQGYTFDLVGGITQTSREFLQQAITQWIASGQPLDSLVDTLEPMFGGVRAEMIAATEVTRSFAEGNMETWRASGVVDGVRWMTAEDELVCPICGGLDGKEATIEAGFVEGPPAHPNCRCWLQPIVAEPE